MGQRILIVGCGGIGGVITANLTRRRQDVVTVSRNEEMRHAIAVNGLTVVRGRKRYTVKPHVYKTPPNGLYDLVILTTQPTDVEAAAHQYGPILSSDGYMLVLQNGLCENRVARILGGPERVLGGVVAWGAMALRPGVVEQTSEGSITFGALAGGQPQIMADLRGMFESIAQVKYTENLQGARWSKLIINSMVSSLGTLNGSRLGDVVSSRDGRRVGLEILTEGVHAARASNIELELVSGTLDLNKMCLRATDYRSANLRLILKHAILCIVGFKYRRLYSSLLRAMEAGKEPAIDFLNGELVGYGQKHGLDMTVNRAVCDQIRAMAAKAIDPGPDVITALRQLGDEHGITALERQPPRSAQNE
jgi:2-dehydropantoate 2-reductase